MLYKFHCPQCEFEIPDVTLDPPRSAPPCSNPDSPAYSDPGDCGGLDLPDFCPNCNVVFDQEAEFQAALESLSDADDYEPEVDDDYVDPRDFDEPDWEDPLIRRKL